MKTKFRLIVLLFIALGGMAQAKKISPDLFGIFFEDINYAADGGLYAEMIQNRSFEYNPSDHYGWNAFTAWDYITKGYAYGTVSIETNQPVHKNNPHYVILNIEDAGSEGIGLRNTGFDGIVVKAGEHYNFSVFLRQLSENQIPFSIKLFDKKGKLLGESTVTTNSHDWKKYETTITATESSDSANLVLLATAKGKVAIDMVSLFPEKTFKNRQNGLRADLAQTIADLHPKFIRFPGGCLVHGDGIGNMYRWENTIGPVEQRVEQKDIWGYHQTAGLGYFEYFQFCEDIGAKPLPVLPAGVSCQNSGGTWRIGGTGQKGIPEAEMPAYIQEVLDLIEWANGPVTSTWGAKRAAAGHPDSFHLQYIGIGNEDKQTPEFRERFKQIYEAVKAKHPEITVIGTVGPAPGGEDFELGWKFARQLQVPIVDEHYYMKPEWFIANQHRYDTYDRKGPKVYVGEYASHGSTLYNALSEAAYMTSLERNGDVVQLSSYAPLLAKKGHTQWNPDLIYFSNTAVFPTVNYYVQKLFATNSGDQYIDHIIHPEKNDSLFAYSVVRETKSGDICLKFVNINNKPENVKIDISKFKGLKSTMDYTILTGKPNDQDRMESPAIVIPHTNTLKLNTASKLLIPPYSLVILRLKSSLKSKK